MLLYLSGAAMRHFPDLVAEMFIDRTGCFGMGRDVYDGLNPIYVIWQRPDGGHGGSMRFLPTLGRTMLDDQFRRLGSGRRIAHAKVWELSRFCLSSAAGPDTGACLMLGAVALGVGFGLSRAVGVGDAGLMRLFGQTGWVPSILGTDGVCPGDINLGLWEFSDDARRRLARRANIALPLSRLWFDQAFGGKDPAAACR